MYVFLEIKLMDQKFAMGLQKGNCLFSYNPIHNFNVVLTNKG